VVLPGVVALRCKAREHGRIARHRRSDAEFLQQLPRRQLLEFEMSGQRRGIDQLRAGDAARQRSRTHLRGVAGLRQGLRSKIEVRSRRGEFPVQRIGRAFDQHGAAQREILQLIALVFKVQRELECGRQRQRLRIRRGHHVHLEVHGNGPARCDAADGDVHVLGDHCLEGDAAVGNGDAGEIESL
jgi:hypothetical protein